MPARFLGRWRRDRRGVSAVEFAFIAPILILCYFGVAELCGAMLAQRKAGHVASEIGDLVAQCQSVALSDFSSTGFWAVGSAVMYPLDTSPLSMRVTSISADSTGKVFTVAWSYDNSGALTKYATGTVLTNAALTGLVPANGSVIMSETRYVYTSPVAIVVKTALPFNSVFYLSPRQMTSIPPNSTACIS
ncbi:MAG: pilus assembly protein [Caulobacteraceae bacterium]|nr:pilus assembly protein [Caulobacteraceae bacterium]